MVLLLCLYFQIVSVDISVIQYIIILFGFKLLCDIGEENFPHFDSRRDEEEKHAIQISQHILFLMHTKQPKMKQQAKGKVNNPLIKGLQCLLCGYCI